MLDGYKIVAVTPAGRRRYLRLLIPYVLSCMEIDRYDLWVNTPDAADLAFMEAVASIDHRIRLVPLPEGIEPGPSAIRKFWPKVTDLDTLYIRFDDDVVWLDPKFFQTFLSFRLGNPQFFSVAPLIINNAMSTYLLQTFGKIKVSKVVGPDRFDRIGWIDPTLARSLHVLLQDLVADNEVGRLTFGRVPLSGNCFSINCISWFGRDIAALGGQIPAGEDEEAAASCTFALRAGRLNCIESAAVAAHFAFYTQRDEMDRTDLLDRYVRIAAERAELEPWRSRVENALRDIEGCYPIHSSLGGFKPLAKRRRSLFNRVFRQSRATETPDITIKRGVNF